eukprot:454993-Rhodomonas_salina.1
MEGIELEAEGYEEGVESGLSALEVLKFKDRECARCDVKYGHSDPLMIRSIVVCLRYFYSLTIRLIIVFLLLVLNVLYWHSREYLDDYDISVQSGLRSTTRSAWSGCTTRSSATSMSPLHGR